MISTASLPHRVIVTVKGREPLSFLQEAQNVNIEETANLLVWICFGMKPIVI